MAKDSSNMRTLKVQPKSKTADVGKMMTDTAVEGADWHSKNETVEYTHGEKPSGPYGGLNSGS